MNHDLRTNPPTHTDPTLRPRIHVVCHTCADDDAAREAIRIEPYSHETLTRKAAYAWMVWRRHRDAGHDVERRAVGR